MKRSIVLALGVALGLSGCKTTSRADPYGPLALSRENGVVMFTIDRHGRSIDRPFAIHAVRYDPKSGNVLSDSDDDGRGFAAVYSTKSEIGQDAKHWAFELEPGHYAIASVDRVGVASQPVFSGGNLAVLLIATAIATAASHAIAAAEHESHEFIRDDHVGRRTPTFTVAAGRVTHIGDFSFSGESRTVEKMVTNENAWGGPNATGIESTNLKTVTEIRTVVDYSFEPSAIDRYLEIRKLDRYPIDHQRLDPLVGRRFVLEDFPGENPDNRTPIREAATPGPIPAVSSTGPPPPVSATPAPLPASTSAPVRARAPATGRTSLSELQELFLSGGISKAEYERERARLAAGS